MRRARRATSRLVGQREARAIAANLGRDARATRKRRRLTQAALARLVDLTQSEISRLELGQGAATSIEMWVAIGVALRRPLAIGFSRDVVDPLQDAGHLAAQELVIGLAGAAGWRPAFEVAGEPGRSGISSDVVLDGLHGVSVLVEIWNRLDDLGAAVRSSDRKLAVARQRAGPNQRVESLWLLTDTAANREIVRRYPAILRARFGSSSSAWIRAVTVGTSPPSTAGLAWVDVRSAALRELRLRERGLGEDRPR